MTANRMADVSGTQWDAPNQQVVRPDESAPWQEGDGGSDYSGPQDKEPAVPEPEPEPPPEEPAP